MKFAVFDSASVPGRIATAAAAIERRYGVPFERYYVFSGSEIRSASRTGPHKTPRLRTTVISNTDTAVLQEIAVLTAIANLPQWSREERDQYLRALLTIYRRVGVSRQCEAKHPAVLVAPKREGATLAKLLCLDRLASRSLFPHAKRIQSDDNIVVGLTFGALPTEAGHYVIVDGAIGSGATLFAIMHHLRRCGRSFALYAVHATRQGLAVLGEFGARFKKDVEVQVGHVSGELNDCYYATEPDCGGRLVVGDLGDTIREHVD